MACLVYAPSEPRQILAMSRKFGLCCPDFVCPFGLIMNHAILFVPVLAWTGFWLGLLGPQTKPALTSSKG